MNMWRARAWQWRQDLRERWPALVSLEQTAPVAPHHGDALWESLGDDFRLFDVEALLNANTPLATGDKATQAFTAFDGPREITALTELSADRLLDASRHLLGEELEQLWPVHHHVEMFQEMHFLKPPRKGQTAWTWSPPLTQRGIDKLADALMEPIKTRVQDVVMSCLSTLFARAERIRESSLETVSPEQAKELRTLALFMDRTEKLMSREGSLSLLRLLREVFIQEWSSLATEWESPEAMEKTLRGWIGACTWPLDYRHCLSQGWWITSVIYGVSFHLGFLTEHVIRCSRWWVERGQERSRRVYDLSVNAGA